MSWLRLHLGVAAQDADAAAAARAQSLQNFDRRRLTRAVGAEHAEDLAGAHFEIDALDGRKTAVALAQGFHLDRIVHEFFSLSQAGSGEVRRLSQHLTAILRPSAL